MPYTVLALAIPMWLHHAITIYGYWVIFIAVSLESLGIPFPGETSLIAGAIYAATTGRISIVFVIVAAAAGAIIGDNIGYTIGYFGGFPLLRTILRKFHIPEDRMRFAQDYFERHGDKTVFLGRFFSLLRIWVAFLAGMNRMPRLSFVFWNASGGIIWAIIYGVIGYVLGHNVAELDHVLTLMGGAGIAAIVLFIAGLFALWIVRRQREHAKLAAVKASTAAQAESPHSAENERDAANTATRG